MVGHSKDFRSLGIDIETRLDGEQNLELAQEILVNAEHERFWSLSQEQRSLLLTLTFSLKESLYKALYPLTGTQFYFEHAELLDWSPDGHARLQLLCDLSDEFPANTEIAGRFSTLDDDLVSYIAIPNRSFATSASMHRFESDNVSDKSCAPDRPENNKAPINGALRT